MSDKPSRMRPRPLVQREDVHTYRVGIGTLVGERVSAITSGIRARFTRNTLTGYLPTVMYAGSSINFSAAVGNPMNNSAVVAVVGWIARNFPDAPLMLARVFEDGRRVPIGPAKTSPGRLLRLMEKPNRAWSGVLMWMATVADLYASGNGYWVKVRNDAGRVIEFWWMPEQMMEPRWQGDDFITYYEQNVDGQLYAWRPEDVIHYRLGLDPNNPRKGLSPLRSLMREIYTDNEASAFTAALLKNLGVPGVIIAPANTVGATIRGKASVIKEQFKDTFGGDNRGEPMVLTAPTDVKVLSFSPEQMEMRDLRKLPEERISAVVGVAAIVAGLGAGLDRSTFSNFGEARKAAYQEAIIPLQRLVAADIEVQTLDDFPDLEETDDSMLDVAFDWRKASAMSEAINEVHKRALEASRTALITRAQFLRETDRPVADDGSDDVYVYPNNFLIVPKAKDVVTSAQLIAPQTGPSNAPQGDFTNG